MTNWAIAFHWEGYEMESFCKVALFARPIDLSHFLWLLLSVACLVVISSNTVSASGGVRTVALTGMHLPSTNDVFGDVGYSGVSLNNRGETAFIVSPSFNDFEFSISPRPITSIDDESVWTEAGGTGLRRIAHEQPESPNEQVFTRVSPPIITDSGITVFRDHSGIWRSQPGEPNSAIATRGSIAPSTNATFDTITNASVNAVGEVAYFGFLSPSLEAGPSNWQGLWSDLGGEELELVARSGDIASGTELVFHRFAERPVIGSGGHTAFRSTVLGANVDSSNDEVLWLAQPTGVLLAVMREAEPATRDGGSIRFLGQPSVNSAGNLAFSSGVVSLPSVAAGNARGRAIWSFSVEEGATLVALAGEQAPSTDSVFGSNHANFATFSNPILGDGGHISFYAELLEGDSRTSSIWLGDPSGELELVARVGSPAPGTSENFSSLGTPTVNTLGQVAFSARMVDFTNRHNGIWAQNPQGKLRSIALAGELLDVSDDPNTPDLRTIEFLSFSGGGAFGGPDEIAGFNDRGQVAFFARFTDGTSGVFVSDLVAVPEPYTVSLIAVALLNLFCGRPNGRVT